MKKLLSFFMVGAILAFASCTKENNPNGSGTVANGEEVVISIKAQHPDQKINTRAAFSNPALEKMRVILMVMNSEGKVVFSDLKTNQIFSSGETLEYNVRLVTGATYTISCWADFGSAYYNVSYADNTIPSVSLVQPINGSNNKRDAYFDHETKTFNASEVITLDLKRPFGLIKIDALDYDNDNLTKAGKTPNYYETTIEVPTTMSLVDGETSDKEAVSIALSQVATKKTTELSFDYFFAEDTQTTLKDFTVIYYNDDQKDINGKTSYTFTGIPIRRNYKTLISGNLFTVGGNVKVSIDKEWNTPEIVVPSNLKNILKNLSPGEELILGSNKLPLEINKLNQNDYCFRIDQSNVTIIGAADKSTVIYETTISGNGNLNTQNFLTIVGNNVTIKNITFRGKSSPNKIAEIFGDNVIFDNCTFTPNYEMSSDPSNFPQDNAGNFYVGFDNPNDPLGTPYDQPGKLKATFKNCLFEYSGITVRPSHALLLENCTFRYGSGSSNWDHDCVVSRSVDVKLVNCNFENINPFGAGNIALSTKEVWGFSNPSSIIFEGCNFPNNSDVYWDTTDSRLVKVN